MSGNVRDFSQISEMSVEKILLRKLRRSFNPKNCVNRLYGTGITHLVFCINYYLLFIA